ncbi:MAG: hypothetical protein AAF264_01200 [Pseudomonadota bacterium]
MSSIVSGVAKVFKPVAAAATKIGGAVAQVGKSVFTAGAAAGAGPIASGGLSAVAKNAGGGVLSNMLSGAAKTAAVGAVVGGLTSAATGGSFAKGALTGGLGGAVVGGVSQSGLMPGLTQGDTNTPARTASSDAPLSGSSGSARLTGGEGGDRLFDVSADVPLPASRPQGLMPSATDGATTTARPTTAGKTEGAGKGLMNFLKDKETLGSILQGAGEAGMKWQENKWEAEREAAQREAQAAEYAAARDFKREQQQQIVDSYKVDDSALHAPHDFGATPPQQQVAAQTQRPRRQYNPQTGRIE